MASVSCWRRPVSAALAWCNACRSSSVPARVFGRLATMINSAAPTADASADAEPPPGVGSLELKASSSSRTDRSTSMHDRSFLDHHGDGIRADAHQIDGRAVHDHRVELFAGLEAADAVVAIERVGAVDRRG